MRVRMGLVAALAVVVLMAIAPAALPVSAQSRTVFWRRWDVNIDNVDTTGNRFDVTELYDVQFTGTFRFGSRVIPMDRLDGIRNVSVEQNGRMLQSGCNQVPGTYCVTRTSEGMSIAYYFFQSITNGSSKFTLAYTVDGALRSYEGGDQLSWYAISPEHFGFPIGASTVTVEMPDGYAPREGVDPVVTYGAPTTVDVQGTKITANTTRQVAGSEALEIRVQYPHNPNMAASDWQAGFDQQIYFEERVQPLINIGVFVVSLVIALGGTLGVYMLYMTRGRDPKVGPVPEYLSEPPSDLSPAVVGALLDEHADVRDVMSILIDLARRGYVVIEEDQTEGLFGIGRSSTFTFKLTDKSTSDLKPYESRLISNMFSGGKLERTLDSMRNKFYNVIPQIQSDLYDALVSEGLFPDKPNAVRTRWSLLGGLLFGLAVVLFIFGVSAAVETYGDILICLPFSLGLVGLVALITAQFMPVKTPKGAEEAAKWNAFREYLSHLDRYDDVNEAAKNFDSYLPYAVAFNIDHSWMQRFREVPTMQVPYWYYPTYMGGPYRRGYVAGTPLGTSGPFSGTGGLPGDIARAPSGGFDLDQMSGNLSAGLENLSSGLTNMIDSASRAMTSRPQSSSSGSSGSWSGGGGSFSGGGGGGGHSSGGGSSGFG